MLQQTGLWGTYGRTMPKHQPKPLGKLDCLEDARPAGLYTQPIDLFTVPMLCLAVIDQALRDIANGQDKDGYTAHWLRTVGKRWLTTMGVTRRGGNGRADVIFEPDNCQLIWEEKETYLPEDR